MASVRKTNLPICLLLVLITLLAYQGLGGHHFLIIDDPAYVTDNTKVQSGLTLENIRWAFTTTRAEFWHPATWLSYMLDTQFFGVTPRGYLFTNLLLHVLNTLLVFLLFRKATGAVWQSGFGAALFALHPLHVESVAWIAERKDVLSTFFGLLTLWIYTGYVRRPEWRRYLAVCLTFVIGLMAKPMLVTLPFVLLLMDYWPLGRLTSKATGKSAYNSALHLVVEKLPLFAMAAAAAAMAYAVQYRSGAVATVDEFPVPARLANALWSYLGYIQKMLWPQDLAVFYPFPDKLTLWKPMAALLILASISIAAILKAKRYPFFITGWLWYLGTLAPVIGLIKIGDFTMADRYTYIPLIGLFIIIAWGIPEILSQVPFKRIIMGFGAILGIAALFSVTRMQLKYWTNSERLLEHALQVTENNFFAHYGLGHVYAGRGKMDEALFHFSRAVQIRPDKATLQNNLGRAFALQGQFEAAITCFSRALEIKPDKIEAHFNLGIAMAACNRPKQAVAHLSEVIRLLSSFSIQPERGPAAEKLNCDKSESMDGKKPDTVIENLQILLAGNPRCLPAIRKLAMAYAKTGQYDKALMTYKIDPSPEKSRQAIINGYQNWEIIVRP